ncbi:MAG TPA: ABC transporter permease [Ilumatobacteraceae bacterium]|nr:ABC transporter permease [Ilumatobacteraceae bacterium]
MRPRYVVGKIAGAIGTLAFVLVFNFFLFRIVNDDPTASMFRGRNLSPSQIQSLREKFNLDGSKLEQFGAYLRETAQGNLGVSLLSRRPVSTEIREAIWPTVLLVGTATAAAMVIGVLLGIHAGWRRRSAFDVGSTTSSMLTYSVPDFWLGMLLLGFLAVRFDVFPTGGLEDPGTTATGLSLLIDQAHHMALPMITLALGYVGEYAIVMRSSMLDTLREDYLQLARAKGLRDANVRRHHAVPNALLPVVSLSALNFGFVLSGAIAVESIFSWPGLGQATFEAIRGPDFPVLQGLFLLFSAALIVANLAVDLLYGYLDPRVAGR